MPTPKKLSANELLIETATTVRLMNERLFGGNGANGAIPDMQRQHRELASQMTVNIAAILDKIDEKKKETDGMIDEIREKHVALDKKVNWYSGGLALLSFLFMYGATLFGVWHRAK